MDITPALAKGRQVIEAYGDGGFRIAGAVHRGAVFVFPDQTLPWKGGLITESAFTSLLFSKPEIILIGTGAQMTQIPPDLRQWLRSKNIAVDVMDTGAACRTFNVLLSEDRRVAAALIAID